MKKKKFREVRWCQTVKSFKTNAKMNRKSVERESATQVSCGLERAAATDDRYNIKTKKNFKL